MLNEIIIWHVFSGLLLIQILRIFIFYYLRWNAPLDRVFSVFFCIDNYNKCLHVKIILSNLLPYRFSWTVKKSWLLQHDTTGNLMRTENDNCMELLKFLMSVADIGDEMCWWQLVGTYWWQLWPFSLSFHISVDHQMSPSLGRSFLCQW